MRATGEAEADQSGVRDLSPVRLLAADVLESCHHVLNLVSSLSMNTEYLACLTKGSNEQRQEAAADARDGIAQLVATIADLRAKACSCEPADDDDPASSRSSSNPFRAL